jgi:hypothetical protein
VPRSGVSRGEAMAEYARHQEQKPTVTQGGESQGL